MLNSNAHYAPIRIHCVNALVNKRKNSEFSITITTKYHYIFFHKACLTESRVLSFYNIPKCMIKIFLESLKLFGTQYIRHE